MKESIICIGKVGEKPYRFQDTGIEISSYEELCYYLSKHMVCYLTALPPENLLDYIRQELGLEKLYRQLIRLNQPDKDQMKYFSTLFREGNYFTEEEIRDILDDYRNLKNAPYSLQCKWLGDLYNSSGFCTKAIQYYREALRQDTLGDAEKGALYHNLGVADARLFRFCDAGIHLIKAYQYTGEEESLFYYFSLVALTEGMDRAKEEVEAFDISDIAAEAFASRFASFQEDYQFSENAAKIGRMVFLQEHGKETEADEIRASYVSSLKKQFRKALEKDETLTVNGKQMLSKSER